MARYDKVDPVSGAFRAPLNADLNSTQATGVGNPVGVSINGSGRVVVGGATEITDPIVGLVCTQENKKAGDIVDVMTDGEIVEMATPAAAGIPLFVNATTGALEAAGPGAGANKVMAGVCIEATRLVVRVRTVQG